MDRWIPCLKLNVRKGRLSALKFRTKYFDKNSAALKTSQKGEVCFKNFLLVPTTKKENKSEKLCISSSSTKIFELKTNGTVNSEETPSEFELNVGKSIDGIRADFHGFLDDGLMYTEVYSSNILLEEPYHSGLKVQGRWLYVLFSKFARLSLLWYYQDVTLTLTHLQLRKSGGNDLLPEKSGSESDFFVSTNAKLTPIQMDKVNFQTKFPTTKDSLPSLYARFILEGTPRPALLLSLPLAAPLPRKTYTVLFKYSFNPNGLVSIHRVEKIQPAPNLNSLFPRLAWWWSFRGAKPEFNV